MRFDARYDLFHAMAVLGTGVSAFWPLCSDTTRDSLCVILTSIDTTRDSLRVILAHTDTTRDLLVGK